VQLSMRSYGKKKGHGGQLLFEPCTFCVVLDEGVYYKQRREWNLLGLRRQKHNAYEEKIYRSREQVLGPRSRQEDERKGKSSSRKEGEKAGEAARPHKRTEIERSSEAFRSRECIDETNQLMSRRLKRKNPSKKKTTNIRIQRA